MLDVLLQFATGANARVRLESLTYRIWKMRAKTRDFGPVADPKTSQCTARQCECVKLRLECAQNAIIGKGNVRKLRFFPKTLCPFELRSIFARDRPSRSHQRTFKRQPCEVM